MSTLQWERHPVIIGGIDTHYAHYSCGNVWVRWCGHPTATHKYFVRGLPALDGQTFRTVKDAKAAVEEWYAQTTIEDGA